jgi:hypothetical protein
MNVRQAVVALLVLSAVRMFGASLELPIPPQQGVPWAPPENVPTNLASAVTALFEQGFPDPRGCEYREIEVVVSDVRWQHHGPVKTRGWVLPAAKGATQRFAICWNGVVYPVRCVGAPGDLQDDVGDWPQASRYRFDHAVGEDVSVLPGHSLLPRVALLLRCGETEAALKLWRSRVAIETGEWGRNPQLWAGPNSDPYLFFAEDWAWALFDRLIAAHMRGDDALALATARVLAELQPKIETEAARRGIARRSGRQLAPGSKEAPYLTFLEQLPRLVADLERRVAEGPRPSVWELGVTNLPTSAERVRALVRELDQVRGHQWSQPGCVDFFTDPIVVLLAGEGEAAVEALLECMESDERLTRSVGFPRDFMRKRTVLPVAKAARAILEFLWQYEFDTAACARAYWNRYKSLPLEERWYAILQNDGAGMDRWLEAARNIVRTQYMCVVPGRGLVPTSAATNGPAEIQGVRLRSKTNPSVSELLARRALGAESADGQIRYDLPRACDIALCLAAWDAQAFVPVGQKLVQRCCTVLKYSPEKISWEVQRLGSYIGRLTVARVAAGDASALADYAACLLNITPSQLAEYLPESLAPLWLFPTNAVIQTFAEQFLSPTNAFWVRLLPDLSARFNSPEFKLTRLPAFRRFLARELGRTNVVGTVTWDLHSGALLRLTNTALGGYVSMGFSAPKPSTVEQREVRWCDWIAWSLQNANQISGFDLFASEGERDRAIERARAMFQE